MAKIDKMAEHYELKYQQAAKTLTAVRWYPVGLQSPAHQVFRPTRHERGV